MTPEFTHCALHVCDLDESIAFYESYCGLRIVKEHGKGKERTVWLAQAGEGAPFVLVLLGGGPERQQSKDDMTHYGFAVASRDDVERVAERGRRDSRRNFRRRLAISARSAIPAATSSSSLTASRWAETRSRRRAHARCSAGDAAFWRWNAQGSRA